MNRQTVPSAGDHLSTKSLEPEILHALADRVDPIHTALIIVDMQKDFCLEGYGAHRAGRDISAARGIVPTVARLLDTARHCGARIAHVGFRTLANHASDSGPWLAQRRRSTASSDTLCIAETDGERFIDELAPRAGEWVVSKHRYSAFTGTDLDLLLRSQRIRTLVITGVSTNACVESTLRAAFDLDYYVCVPPDGVASWSNALHDATLANVDHRFGITPAADDVIAAWSARSLKQKRAG